MSIAAKNELLFRCGINFNEVPNWLKRGVGLSWEKYDKPAVNPRTGHQVVAERARVKIDYELPMRHEYAAFVLACSKGLEGPWPRHPASARRQAAIGLDEGLPPGLQLFAILVLELGVILAEDDVP
jgi:hypothetical protein